MQAGRNTTQRLRPAPRPAAWGALARLAPLALLAACNPREPQPPPADHQTLRAEDCATAVLAACHGPLRGRLDRVDLRVRCSDGSQWQVYAALPTAARIVGSSGVFLVRDGTIHAVDDKARTKPPDTDLQARLLALRLLADAAALGPLQRAQHWTKNAPGSFTLTTSNQETWQLQLRPGTLLPQALQSGAQRLRFDHFLPTATTWMPARVELAPLGLCDLQFELADIDWRPDFFEPPSAPRQQPAAPERIPFLPPGAEPRSPDPFVVTSKALQRVLLHDPGDWPSRTATYAPVHDELVRQGQSIVGFPMLLQRDGTPLLAVPFRQRAGGPPLSPPKEWRIEPIAESRWLVVYPPDGDLAQRCRDGATRLQAALAQLGLDAAGPLVYQPFLHLHEGEPSTERLAAPVVRVSLPLR